MAGRKEVPRAGGQGTEPALRSGVPSRGSPGSRLQGKRPHGATWNSYCPFAAEQGREQTEGGRQGLTQCQEQAAARGPTEPSRRNLPCCRGARPGFLLPSRSSSLPPPRSFPACSPAPAPCAWPNGAAGARAGGTVPAPPRLGKSQGQRPQSQRHAQPTAAARMPARRAKAPAARPTAGPCKALQGPWPAGQASPGRGRAFRDQHPPSRGVSTWEHSKGSPVSKDPLPRDQPTADCFLGWQVAGQHPEPDKCRAPALLPSPHLPSFCPLTFTQNHEANTKTRSKCVAGPEKERAHF